MLSTSRIKRRRIKRRSNVRALLGVTALCVLVSTASAQNACTRLAPDDLAPVVAFGRSFDVSHDRIVVGAPGLPNAMKPPAAYVFEQTGEGWTERARLTLDDPEEVFGWHVALGDDRLGVAGPRLHASLFEWNNADWTATGTIPDYGHMIFRGDTLLIGGPGASDPTSPFAAGAVRVYVRDQATWNQIQIMTGREQENFGQFFVLDGNWLAAAGWGGLASSHVKIFRRAGSAEPWQIETEFIVSAQNSVSLDLKDDRLIVGVPSNSNNTIGVVYDYRWDGRAWNRIGMIAPPAEASRGFGDAVALQGDTLVVGDPHDAQFGPSSGAAYIYLWQDTTWVEQGRITAGGAAGRAYFGSPLQIDKGRLFIGAPFDGGQQASAGAVYVCPFMPGTTVSIACPGARISAPGRCDTPPLPAEALILENHPNPFTESTTIRYALPEAGAVDLAVYDVLGRRVATLAHGHTAAGHHTIHFDGSGLVAGHYFCVLRSKERMAVKALLLAR